MKISITHLEQLRALCVHHVGAYQAIAQAFVRLDSVVGHSALLKLPGVNLIAVYHDDPDKVPEGQLRADVGITVPLDAPCLPGLRELCIAAGRYACTTHIGPYTRLGQAWSQFWGSGLASHGLRALPQPHLEIYRNTPRTTQPEALRTDLLIPVE